MSSEKSIVKNDLKIILNKYQNKILTLFNEEIKKVKGLSSITQVSNDICKLGFERSLTQNLEDYIYYIKENINHTKIEKTKINTIESLLEPIEKYIKEDSIIRHLNVLSKLFEYLIDRYSKIYWTIMDNLDNSRIKKYLNDNKINKIDFDKLLNDFFRRGRVLDYKNTFCNEISLVLSLFDFLLYFCKTNLFIKINSK